MVSVLNAAKSVVGLQLADFLAPNLLMAMLKDSVMMSIRLQRAIFSA